MSLCDSCGKGRPLGVAYAACPSRSPTVASCTGYQPAWTPEKGGETMPKKCKKAKAKKAKTPPQY